MFDCSFFLSNFAGTLKLRGAVALRFLSLSKFKSATVDPKGFNESCEDEENKEDKLSGNTKSGKDKKFFFCIHDSVKDRQLTVTASSVAVMSQIMRCSVCFALAGCRFLRRKQAPVAAFDFCSC